MYTFFLLALLLLFVSLHLALAVPPLLFLHNIYHIMVIIQSTQTGTLGWISRYSYQVAQIRLTRKELFCCHGNYHNTNSLYYSSFICTCFDKLLKTKRFFIALSSNDYGPLESLCGCIDQINCWRMSNNFLHLNKAKTEIILIRENLR